jgi:hypothetical protein
MIEYVENFSQQNKGTDNFMLTTLPHPISLRKIYHLLTGAGCFEEQKCSEKRVRFYIGKNSPIYAESSPLFHLIILPDVLYFRTLRDMIYSHTQLFTFFIFLASYDHWHWYRHY